ncbi:hypothetical protein T12_15759, partial [Trichinella patagoniensis]
KGTRWTWSWRREENVSGDLLKVLPGERAQSSFDVVFSAVVLPKTASTGMLLVNPFVSSIGGEAQ